MASAVYPAPTLAARWPVIRGHHPVENLCRSAAYRSPRNGRAVFCESCIFPIAKITDIR